MVAAFFAALVITIVLGFPIVFSMLVSGVALMLLMGVYNTQIVVQNLVAGADSFPLMAIPFFILAGELMNAGGLSHRIINLASTMVGHLKGGLGYVAIIAGLIFASLSGSAVADTAAIGAILIPMMVKNGYDIKRSSGLIATAGVIAPIFPPSIGFIMFGVIGGVSITKLFIAGIVPGLLMAVALMVTWAIVVRKDEVVPQEKKSAGDVIAALREGIWPLFMPVIIIGGLKGGMFTPTEAGVVAAVYALFVGAVIYRAFRLESLIEVAVRTARLTGVIMLLVCAALVSSWIMTLADLPGQVADLLSYISQNKVLLLIVINIIVILAGTFLDMAPAILILTPILLPAVVAAGIDPVYFGVLFIMNNAIGLLTPPVGIILNVISGVAKISLEDATKGVWQFLLAEIIVLFLLILFPALVTKPLEWFL